MQIVRPSRIQASRVYGGTDYGPRQRLLVDAPDARLMWVPGHISYLGRVSGSQYAKSTLLLVRNCMSLSRRVVLRIEGGRLTKDLLKSDPVQSEVIAMWGDDVAKSLEVNATIVIGISETEDSHMSG